MDDVISGLRQMGIQPIQKSQISSGPGRRSNRDANRLDTRDRLPKSAGDQVHLVSTTRKLCSQFDGVSLRAAALFIGPKNDQPDSHDPTD